MNTNAMLDHWKVNKPGQGAGWRLVQLTGIKALSIRETEDGRILLYDFAGCDTASILVALGLSLSDLFPDKRDHHVKPTHSRIPARDLFALIDHESLIVLLAASDFLRTRTIDDENMARLTTAVRRIGKARDYVSA